MAKRPNPWTVEDRARWLSELAIAVADAQELVWRICAQGGANGRASELYGRLESARDEIAALRRSTAQSAWLKTHPEWSELLELVGGPPAHTPTGMSPPPENG